ncbi:hypothetical protein BJ912DRAFT_1126587 [Pholiota molesta]|nr:hypothetical protein BJ912DRAFT_1126587 [Pholiota molesta]
MGWDGGNVAAKAMIEGGGNVVDEALRKECCTSSLDVEASVECLFVDKALFGKPSLDLPITTRTFLANTSASRGDVQIPHPILSIQTVANLPRPHSQALSRLHPPVDPVTVTTRANAAFKHPIDSSERGRNTLRLGAQVVNASSSRGSSCPAIRAIISRSSRRVPHLDESLCNQSSFSHLSSPPKGTKIRRVLESAARPPRVLVIRAERGSDRNSLAPHAGELPFVILVFDRAKLSSNDHVGDARLDVEELVESAPCDAQGSGGGDAGIRASAGDGEEYAMGGQTWVDDAV